MKIRLIFILTFSFVAIVTASAQTRTVTNDDLEKYRQTRVRAERDLRENYERLGFPSPAELEKQLEKSRAEKIELAARLEAENIERERLALERRRAENESRFNEYQIYSENRRRGANDYFTDYPANGFYGFSSFGFPNQPFRRFNRNGFGTNNRRGFGGQPRVEYRNNLPVIVRPAPPRIFAPLSNGGRRN